MITWKSGFERFYKNVSAERVYQEIASIGESATPEQIVEAAKDEDSELHKCFTWDDSVAAEKWRKQEARQLRHFLVIRDEEHPDAPDLCALHFTVSGEGYKTAPRVFQNPDETAALLKRAYAELHTFAERNRFLSDDLGEILEMIDSLPY